MNCLQYAAYRVLPVTGPPFGDPNRVVHMQEVIKIATLCGYAVTEFQAAPVLESGVEIDNVAFFEEMMLKSELGILTGETGSGVGHAIGFRGFDNFRLYYDARQRTSSRAYFDFKIRALFNLNKIKSN